MFESIPMSLLIQIQITEVLFQKISVDLTYTEWDPISYELLMSFAVKQVQVFRFLLIK